MDFGKVRESRVANQSSMLIKYEDIRKMVSLAYLNVGIVIILTVKYSVRPS